ncbi:type II secretion system F family protein [Candidatus Pacearchaeota archaeon]|nr:type II secretion system F family protein [Candidatus Pacearchaeota archaeon]
MFEDLKRNLKQEKKIVADMKAVAIGFGDDSANRNFYALSLRALAEQLDLLNNAVPELLKEWLVSTGQESEVGKQKKADIRPVEKEIIKVSYVSPLTKEKNLVVINKKDRVEFLKKLKLSEESLVGIKKLESKRVSEVVKKPNPYVGFSNKFFRKYSERLTPKFSNLSNDLKRANIRFLLSSYLSMAMMSSVIAFAFGFLIFVVLMLFSLSNWIFVVLPFGFVGLTLAGFYFYPASETSTVQKNISYELPFATIHMAAIAGSNIEPVKIFKIIATSGDYPNVGAEVRKVITQVEVYGYDLVTALKNVSKNISNKKLAELFSGLATNITTGGALKNYLKKKSENFLVDYRLERQKYSALAGTFMDVYISILIAAPLVLMMMFIIMNAIGLGMAGLSITMLLMLSVLAIVIVNIIFLVVINLKQPKV